MKKTIIALALAAGLTSFAGSAKAALQYNFSITGSGLYSSSTDTVTGTLTLNDTGTAATSLLLTGDIGGNLSPLDTTINWVQYTSGDNSFTVADGVITAANFVAGGNFSNQNGSVSRYLDLGLYGEYNGYSAIQWRGNQKLIDDNVFNYDGLAGITFTPVTGGADTAAVPEPSQVAASLLLVGGIAGFVIVKRRKEASELEVLAA